ncbi:MAG: preprotein translocase subunit SecG [Pseudomonadota bacterium]|nr:preprotein translocase subunit SecG [Pseudomonadota bacterium]
METFVWIIHTLAALSVVGLVLLQHGKGADMGAAFGSGSAGSLFGASGASNFLSKTTGVLAAIFFISSLGLTYLSGHRQIGGVMQSAPAAAPPAPAATEKKVDVPATTAAPATKPASATPTPATTEPAAADSKAKDIPK